MSQDGMRLWTVGDDGDPRCALRLPQTRSREIGGCKVRPRGSRNGAQEVLLKTKIGLAERRAWALPRA